MIRDLMRVIRFEGWKVDFHSGEISKDGAMHRLQDQPLQILDELVKQPGEVVTRDQLIARLWPTGVVEFDTGLNSAMRKLRSALGDDPDAPRYIETLPRKGYRFIGKLIDEAENTIPSLPKLASDYRPTSFESGAGIGRRASDRRAPVRRLALGFGSILAAIVLAVVAWNMPGKLFQATPAPEKLPTIVVLPLVDMSVAQSEQALADGLTDELSNWLAHIPTLRVVADYVDGDTRHRRGAETLDGPAWAARLRERSARATAAGHRFEATELVQRRNLVFLGWSWGPDAGTWVLSFGRDGRVLEWLEP